MRRYASLNYEESSISLESQLTRISLENEAISNLLDTFKNTIPNFVTAIKNANITRQGFFNDNTEKYNELFKKKKTLNTQLNNIDYLNFGEKIITIPENFKGDLLTYAKHIDVLIKKLYNINSTIMVEYNAILSSFLTNKDDKISLKDHTSFFKRVQVEREEVLKILGGFTKDTPRNQVKLRKVLNRLADVEPLVDTMLSISKVHTTDVLTNINSSVQQSTELLDLIIKRVNESDISNISGASALNISKGAYEVAKLVELVGILYYDVNVLLSVTIGIVDKINELHEGD